MLNKYTITCYIDEDTKKLLSETTELYNELINGTTNTYRMFDLLFGISNEQIQEILSSRKDFLKKELENRQRAQ